MAGGAIAADAIVIEDRREKRRRVVAEVTILRGGHMVRRRLFTDGVDAIVTTGAVVRDTGMIKHAGGKAAGVMTYAAIFRSWDVRRGFTCGDSAVMAGCAIACDTLVSENRGKKRRGGMTKVAILRGG